MKIPLFVNMLGFAGSLTLIACTPVKETVPDHQAKVEQECLAGADRSVLAGPWLYEEQGYIYTLRLDKQGNGAYEWKGGRFLTSCLEKTRWRGTWKRAQDDSEGAFEISLSEDLTMGEGQWWYTRIGKDRGPMGPKSEFQVKRIGALGRESGAPSARRQSGPARVERP